MFYYEVFEMWALFHPLNTPIWVQPSSSAYLQEQLVHLKIAVETLVVEPDMAVVVALLEQIEKKVAKSASAAPCLHYLYLKMMLLQLLLV